MPGWRARAKRWKKEHGLSDADIAAKAGVARSTANSWINKREPNLADVMSLIEAMDADPGHILFDHAITAAPRPTATVETTQPTKAQAFKAKRRRLRR